MQASPQGKKISFKMSKIVRPNRDMVLGWSVGMSAHFPPSTIVPGPNSLPSRNYDPYLPPLPPSLTY